MQQATLTVKTEGKKPVGVTLFPSSETVLGRSSECTVVLEDDRASRRHAAVFFRDGHWFVRDLKSRNGTLLRNQLVSGDMPIDDGDMVGIGHCEILFHLLDPNSVESTENDFLGAGATVSCGTGVFGISEHSGVGPSDTFYDPDEIIERRVKTSYLDSGSDAITDHVTHAGYDSANLCQLAFQLGKATSLKDVSQLTISGLTNATDADAAAIWLLPQEVKSTFRVSQLRLVAHAGPDDRDYVHIPEKLAKTVIENREAILINDQKSRERVKAAETSYATGAFPSSTLVAPVRFRDNILGLLHLYHELPGRFFSPEDLEYTLAVADTLGAALAHVTRERELIAHLDDAKQENIILRELLNKDTVIIGVSPAMRRVGDLVERASDGKATLLIRGESGTGKELIARAAHFAGSRKSKPFVCLNCAAISESLLASELFGHEKGAFTGATERKIGKFEAANHGTLFLDEIGEMKSDLQAKLLRVLEGHAFERVGGNAPISVDVRVVAATNRDLEKEVAEGRFRHDLFFRLRVLEIIVPPLRKRREDISVLAVHFLERFRRETGRKIDGFSQRAMRLLNEYRWPGNIRELKNAIERAVLMGTDSLILESDITFSSLRTTGDTNVSSLVALPHGVNLDAMSADSLHAGCEAEDDTSKYTPMTLEQWEKQHIEATLQFSQWNKSNAARVLGIERTTLDRKIKRYGLDKE
ncbi:MAG: sigma 54-interacting transcriptional regulator [Planctomycetaceae bacterium]|nr:sigma 54-interacting transcriptional regulator [Planctomycetaceae bacterium]